VYPPPSVPAWHAYLERLKNRRRTGFVIRERSTRRAVGIVNLSEIVRGSLNSAYLGC